MEKIDYEVDDFMNYCDYKGLMPKSMKSNENLVNTLFEKEQKDFMQQLQKKTNIKFKKKNLKKANEKIFNKYENAWDIISELENWQNISDEISYIIELQMYKYGVYGGIKLILDSINK